MMGKETKKAQEVQEVQEVEQQQPQDENKAQFTAKVDFVNDVAEDATKLAVFTNADFETIDYRTKEVKNTNVFNMKIGNLQSQIKEFFPILQTLSLLVGTQPINRNIIKLCLGGSEITFIREYHEAGSEREYEGTYESDLWTTKIIGVKPNINQLSQAMMTKFVENGEFIDMKATKAKDAAEKGVPNLFAGLN